jgi:hypothetical protein
MRRWRKNWRKKQRKDYGGSSGSGNGNRKLYVIKNKDLYIQSYHPHNSKKIIEVKYLTDGTTVDATALATSTLLLHGTAGIVGMSGTHTGARNRLKKNLFCTTELGSWALCMFKSTYTDRQRDGEIVSQ